MLLLLLVVVVVAEKREPQEITFAELSFSTQVIVAAFLLCEWRSCPQGDFELHIETGIVVAPSLGARARE